MKKYNSIAKKEIRKEKINLSIVYILTFLLIFLILGFSSSILINNVFFKGVKQEMNALKITLSNDLIKEEKNGIITYHLSKDSNVEARLNFILYTEDYEDNNALYYTSGVMNYFISDYQDYIGPGRIDIPSETYASLLEQVNLTLANNFFDLRVNDLNKFVLESVSTNNNIYYFYTISFAIDGRSNQTASNIEYAKIMMMVNGEVHSEQRIIKVYYMCAAIMFVLACFSSITLAMRAIKPIEEALLKEQKFVGDASHELRTPLSIIQSKLENILTKSEEKIYDVSDDIVVSLSEISRLSKLVKELLVLSKDDHKETVLNAKEIDLTALINETAGPFKEMAEIDNKSLNVVGEKIIVKLDEALIKQLIIIILDNALRYTSPNDNIDIIITKENNYVNVEIKDTGIGISEETKKHIFERFYREDKARSRATGGNGLGMAIAKTIINQHKGKIWVDHNNPKGTKVIFCLPIK